jgi:NAD-dependent oxidoreductase involved in siderophore biosynthesis
MGVWCSSCLISKEASVCPLRISNLTGLTMERAVFILVEHPVLKKAVIKVFCTAGRKGFKKKLNFFIFFYFKLIYFLCF